MEYIYSAMVLYAAGKDITEDAVTAVLKAAGVDADAAKSHHSMELTSKKQSNPLQSWQLPQQHPQQHLQQAQQQLPQTRSPKRKQSVRKRLPLV